MSSFRGVHYKLFPQYALWSLLLIDATEQELYFWNYEYKGEEAEALRRLRIKLGQGVAGWVAQNREAVVVPNVREDKGFVSSVDMRPQTDVQSLVAVPLRVGKRCVGIIEIVNCVRPGGFPQTELSLLETFADFAGISIATWRYNWDMFKGNVKDNLTGLYNARFINEALPAEVRRCQRHGRISSVVVLDIEDFSHLSESLSWRRFNQLLLELGEKIQALVRVSDVPAWYSPGEVIALLPETPKQEACQFAQRLHEMIGKTNWLPQDSHHPRLAASLGIATFPEDGENAEELLKSMYDALFIVKNSKSGGVAAAKLGLCPSR